MSIIIGVIEEGLIYAILAYALYILPTKSWFPGSVCGRHVPDGAAVQR